MTCPKPSALHRASNHQAGITPGTPPIFPGRVSRDPPHHTVGGFKQVDAGRSRRRDESSLCCFRRKTCRFQKWRKARVVRIMTPARYGKTRLRPIHRALKLSGKQDDGARHKVHPMLDVTSRSAPFIRIAAGVSGSNGAPAAADLFGVCDATSERPTIDSIGSFAAPDVMID